MGIYLLMAVLVIILATVIRCIRIVPQAEAFVIEFLGSYKTTWGNGLHLKLPFVERVARKVSLKEQVEDFPPQPVITKDNVTVQIDTVVYFTIFEPKAWTYGVENPLMALGNLTATTLRNIVGSMELDETLTSRDSVNAQMQSVLDEATDKWGIKVHRVEIKNIMPPQDIRESMEKQMKAERERRQTVLEAEAHKASSITRAEGDKEALILQAEAERDAAIARATGEAESIKLVYEAEAQGLERLAQAQISENVVILRKLDALKALGDGRATKIVVPTELASSAASLSFVGETLNITKDVDTSPKRVPTVKVRDDCCDTPERSTVTQQHVTAGGVGVEPTRSVEHKD